jgi:hypothetical protein
LALLHEFLAQVAQMSRTESRDCGFKLLICAISCKNLGDAFPDGHAVNWSCVPTCVVPLVALGQLVGACGSSTQTGQTVADARGCSDWPSRPGETFVSLDEASQSEVEPFFITSPGDLAIAWEAYGCDDLTRVGYTRGSASGGLEKPRYLASPNGQMASNVTLARDGASALFAAWASWTPGPDRVQPQLQASDLHIQFARWPVGTSGFLAPVEVSEPIATSFYDKPWMILTASNQIIIGYSDLSRGAIWVASSADGGASFQRTLVDSVMGNFAGLCPDGRPGGAFLTYFAYRTIRLAHTSDGGVTWSAPVDAAVSDSSGDVAGQDPMCVADGDEVWISYGRTHDGYDVPVQRLLAVLVAHMTLGASLRESDVTVLAADAGSPAGDGGTAQGFLLFPQFARRADGALGLAAYRAAGTGAGLADLVYLVSADGGRSFGTPIRLATGLTPSLQRHVSDWLGDYFGWGPSAAGLGAAFVDNASGFSHIVFDETVPAGNP